MYNSLTCTAHYVISFLSFSFIIDMDAVESVEHFAGAILAT